ncbi:MAG TPA: hypothetical protein VNO30_50525 [Kofleriaceae bacterium]|nr:hypothetical protein [Kofleriaceae bacterium]
MERSSSTDDAADLVIEAVLDDLGFTGDNARLARTALEEAGLTNAKKKRISAAKLSDLRSVLSARFMLVCTRAPCREAAVAAGANRTVLAAARPTACEVCGGSANAAEIGKAITALVDGGLRRIVVVGGSPSTREELRSLIAGRLELRLVSGTDRRTSRDAKADLSWADLVVIWGSTELDHKISKLYTGASQGRVVTCAKRGIAALAETLAKAAARS